MTKRMILLALCSLLLAPCAAAEAQQPKKVSRIGYLSNTDAATDAARAEGTRLALHELGYIEGQHFHRVPICGGEARSGPEHAAELGV